MGFLVCVHVDFTSGAARLTPYHPLLVGCDISDRRWPCDCLAYCAYTVVFGYKVDCGGTTSDYLLPRVSCLVVLLGRILWPPSAW